LVCLAFKIHKHDAVAILRMARDYQAVNDSGIALEPECEVDATADGKWDEELDVTASAAEVGGFEAHGNVAAFLVNFDLDVCGETWMPAALGFGCGGLTRLGGGRRHESLRRDGRNSSPPTRIIGNLRCGVQVMHHSRGLLRDTTQSSRSPRHTHP